MGQGGPTPIQQHIITSALSLELVHSQTSQTSLGRNPSGQSLVSVTEFHHLKTGTGNCLTRQRAEMIFGLGGALAGAGNGCFLWAGWAMEIA